MVNPLDIAETYASPTGLRTARIFIGPTTPPVRLATVLVAPLKASSLLSKIDYEQQRLHLLHKYGIDLESGNSSVDGTKTRRMDRKDVERLMGGGEGKGGIFTWREKNSRKV